MRHIKFFLSCILLCIVLFHVSCGGGNASSYTSDAGVLNRQMISAAKHTIHTGDIVLRSGSDFTSYRIRELSEKDKTYSHAGIACVIDTNVYIYHIVPPDIDESKADSTLRLETLEQFAKPSKCLGFGIIRYQLTEDEIARSIHYLDSLKDRKIPFDYFFDLADPHKMYCSEMIDNTLRYATSGKITLGRKTFNRVQARRVAGYLHMDVREVMKHDYIPIDNIYLHAGCTVIYKYVFLK